MVLSFALSGALIGKVNTEATGSDHKPRRTPLWLPKPLELIKMIPHWADHATPQEVLEQQGYIVLGCDYGHVVGETLPWFHWPNSNDIKAPTVIIAVATESEFETQNIHFFGITNRSFNFYYRVTAE